MAYLRWQVDGAINAYQQALDDARQQASSLQLTMSVFAAAAVALGAIGAAQDGLSGRDSIVVVAAATVSLLAAAYALIRNDAPDAEPEVVAGAAGLTGDSIGAADRDALDRATIRSVVSRFNAAQDSLWAMRIAALVCVGFACLAAVWLAVAVAHRW